MNLAKPCFPSFVYKAILEINELTHCLLLSSELKEQLEGKLILCFV